MPKKIILPKSGQTVIHFEDRGQDFLTWTLDEKGWVVDCQPFQKSIWKGGLVKNFKELELGSTVEYITKDGYKCLKMNYPVARIDKQSQDGKSFFGSIKLKAH
jgi:hypothetical protein